MTEKNSKENSDETVDAVTFLEGMKEFALTVGEDCPEGHRKDPASGRCLPIGGQDHTAYTRSLNNDDGPQWRGEASILGTDPLLETAVDADEMDEPESCAEGTTFSFLQRRCVTEEEADIENEEGFARDEAGEPIEEDAGHGGHKEITLMQPDGRRDPVNHDCPSNQIFNYARRECIPLNKDTVMASDLSEEFKQSVASMTFARLAMTSPDPIDGHRHIATLDEEGNGVTSVGGNFSHMHSHEVKKFNIVPRTGKENGEEYTSQHPGVAVPEEHRVESLDAVGNDETAAPITTTQRKGLSDSIFGVPGKRKFPLDSCARVRNAMARFNQAKGLTSGEKAALRRKILARAKACSIEVNNFAKATTDIEFAELVQEMIREAFGKTRERIESYRAQSEQGPCPPGMIWEASNRRCTKVSGLVSEIANHADIVALDPEGRRDTVGYSCPDGWFFDFSNRRCVPLDPSNKPGTTTSKASREGGASKVLAPNPEGRPADLPQDCPAGTIWDGKLEICKPLDSSKKTKSAEEEAAMPDFLKKIIDKKKGKDGKNGKDGKDKKGKKGGFPFNKFKKKSEEEDATSDGQTTPNGSGKKKGPGCPEGQFMNPVTKKCQPRSGAFKGADENAENAQPGNREGLTSDPAGRIKHPTDCPSGTAWNAVRRVCSPLSSMDKNRPNGASPQPATNVATEVDEMSEAQLIQKLDEILKSLAGEHKEKSKVAAKNIPNAAFPPSLVSETRRSLMHHTADVQDPYSNDSVDVARLRNSLFRASAVKDFSEKAVLDAREHLLFHARSIVAEYLAKKA